jgi:hypothetical protein
MPQHPTSSLANYPGFAIPQAELRRREHLGRNLLQRLVETGELTSLIVGGRIRFITLESWNDYLARQLAGGIPRDPKLQADAREAYRLSLDGRGGRATKLARSGWTGDGKPGRAPNPLSKSAARPGSASLRRLPRRRSLPQVKHEALVRMPPRPHSKKPVRR